MRGIAHFLTGTSRRSIFARIPRMVGSPRRWARPRVIAAAPNAGSSQALIARVQTVTELPPKFWQLLLGSVVCVAALQCAYHGFVTARLATVLETRFPRASLGDARSLAGIVVLGGGEERLREAGRLARAHDHLRVFVSGAGEIGDVRLHLGADIALERIGIENRARNTFENAQFSNARVRPRAGERWLLVTSATHMPRAVGAFRSVGFDIEPWPVYDLPRDDRAVATVLQHETLGLLWYWALGRSSALFPSPLTRADLKN